MPDFEQPEDWSKRPHVVVVVDESGSMSLSRQTTISAINEYITSLKNTLPADARVTIVKFDSGFAAVGGVAVNVTRVRDKVPLGEVGELTEKDYNPNGGTPLYDAIGRTIRDIDLAVKEEPAPVFLCIMTDGYENSSREFTQPMIKSLISERERNGWTVNFLGVDIDAYAVGHHFGISPDNTVSIKRANLGLFADSLSASTSVRYGMASGMASSGASIREYGASNLATKTFSEQDKVKLETDTKTDK